MVQTDVDSGRLYSNNGLAVTEERPDTLQGEPEMLVLSRKLGEKVVIGTDITITLVEVKGNRVKIGISAPGDIPVFRAELVQEGSSCCPPEGEMMLGNQARDLVESI
jgi:carbon storage regulator